MAGEHEQEFEVVDRRRVRADVGPSEGVAGAPPPMETTGDTPPGGDDPDAEEAYAGEETEGGPAMGMPPVDLSVTGILVTTVNLLHERAWICLGLVPDPFTGKLEQNLSEARRGIDALADMVKHLEPAVSAEEKRELQTLLSNLRMNFVRQSSGGS